MVILYADSMTGAMHRTLEETNRRRRIQKEYNEKHGITPESIIKSIDEILMTTVAADGVEHREKISREEIDILDLMDSQEALANLRKRMKEAADQLEFEEAATLRDEILKIEESVKGISLSRKPESPKK
jgi:excinuclease ABC subunit B